MRMFIFLMILMFLPPIADAGVDTLYSVDFNSPGEDWSWGSNWDVYPDFIRLYLNHYSYSGYTEISDSLISQFGYVLPVTPDSLVLEFDNFWHA